MSELLTDWQVTGGEFDQPSCPVRHKLIICTTGRSGSFLLCRAMIHNRIGVPHEYFSGVYANAIATRLGLGTVMSPDLAVDGLKRQSYIDALLNRRTVNGIFAIKIHRGQFEQYLKNAPAKDLIRGAKFIYLYREDLLAQAVSFHISQLTGRWGIGSGDVTKIISEKKFFDNTAINNTLRMIADQDRDWRLFFAYSNIAPLFLSYESLISDISGALQKIALRFGLGLETQDLEYDEKSLAEVRGPGEPSKAEIQSQFLQSMK
jgi:LPS sulfotransferase NodH